MDGAPNAVDAIKNVGRDLHWRMRLADRSLLCLGERDRQLPAQRRSFSINTLNGRFC